MGCVPRIPSGTRCRNDANKTSVCLSGPPSCFCWLPREVAVHELGQQVSLGGCPKASDSTKAVFGYDPAGEPAFWGQISVEDGSLPSPTNWWPRRGAQGRVGRGWPLAALQQPRCRPRGLPTWPSRGGGRHWAEPSSSCLQGQSLQGSGVWSPCWGMCPSRCSWSPPRKRCSPTPACAHRPHVPCRAQPSWARGFPRTVPYPGGGRRQRQGGGP